MGIKTVNNRCSRMSNYGFSLIIKLETVYIVGQCECRAGGDGLIPPDLLSWDNIVIRSAGSLSEDGVLNQIADHRHNTISGFSTKSQTVRFESRIVHSRNDQNRGQTGK